MFFKSFQACVSPDTFTEETYKQRRSGSTKACNTRDIFSKHLN